MPYDNNLKVDLEIFSSPVSINAGGPLLLTPVYHSMLDNEAALYMVNSNNSDVKKFLPSVYADTEEKARKILLEFLERTAFKKSLLLCIRFQKLPIGYINFNFPTASVGVKEWSVDFWLGLPMRGKGIMVASLSNSLLYLQKYKVPRVAAFVDKSNFKSISVLERVGFVLIGEPTEGKLVYSVGL